MKATHEIGLLAEWLCLLRLWLCGWRVLARRWRHPAGEIDLIMRRGNVIAFIEVKTRKDRDTALTAITLRQRQRITTVAGIWLAQNAQNGNAECRFDVMWVGRWPWPRHVANAWSA